MFVVIVVRVACRYAFAIHIVACRCCCRLLLLWYDAMLHCLLKCLEQLLPRWFIVVFHRTHCDILVLLLVLVIVVLCNVALSSRCFKAVVAIH